MQATVQIWNLHTGALEVKSMRHFGVNGVGVCEWITNNVTGKKSMVLVGLDNRLRVYM